MFEAGFNSSKVNQIIGLDHLILLDEKSISGFLPPDTFTCPGTPTTTISCSFENGNMCGWSNDDLGLNWILANGSLGQAPLDISGAAAGASYLAAIANHRPFGDSIARITSRPITSAMPSNTRFSFWFNMKGSGIRYLRLILREAASDQVLWEREGHQGLAWKMINITVCAHARSQFVLEAFFRLPDHFVGIDEILYQGEFSSDLAEPGRCPVVSCNFENHFCGWTNHPESSSPRARSVLFLSSNLDADKAASLVISEHLTLNLIEMERIAPKNRFSTKKNEILGLGADLKLFIDPAFFSNILNENVVLTLGGSVPITKWKRWIIWRLLLTASGIWKQLAGQP